jgi:hypothetical protein
LGILKYLCKYICKETNLCHVEIIDGVSTAVRSTDEIRDFQIMRYVGACESAYRLLGFLMHFKTNPTTLLPVHEPGKNVISYFPGLEDEALRRHEVSMLDAYFAFVLKLKTSDEPQFAERRLRWGQTIVYPDIATLGVWKTESKQWTIRTKAQQVSLHF